MQKHPSEDEVFDAAVALSLEWGKEWLQPINARIRKQYAFLSEEQAEALNGQCKEIQKFCWEDLCYQELSGRIDVREIERQLRVRYPRLSRDNISRLISQGVYYARK